MANKEKIDYLLLDISELEMLVAGMRDAEIYPVSFFGQTFGLAHKILSELQAIEANQVELLRKQMEEHQALIQFIPHSVPDQPVSIESIPVQSPVQSEVLSVEKEIVPPPVVVQEVVREVSIEQPEPIVIVPEPAPKVQEEMPYKAVVTEKAGLFLSDLLEKKNLSDFRKAFSLNDRFRFRRELFGGNEERMNKAITDLNDIHTYEDSVTYLNNELKWNIEDEAVADFLKLLEKRFL